MPHRWGQSFLTVWRDSFTNHLKKIALRLELVAQGHPLTGRIFEAGSYSTTYSLHEDSVFTSRQLRF